MKTRTKRYNVWSLESNYFTTFNIFLKDLNLLAFFLQVIKMPQKNKFYIAYKLLVLFYIQNLFKNTRFNKSLFNAKFSKITFKILVFISSKCKLYTKLNGVIKHSF